MDETSFRLWRTRLNQSIRPGEIDAEHDPAANSKFFAKARGQKPAAPNVPL